MNQSSESELAKRCLKGDIQIHDEIQDIVETIGISEHEILKRVFENSEYIKILKEATSRLKKLRK